jgi:hypothetical protein
LRYEVVYQRLRFVQAGRDGVGWQTRAHAQHQLEPGQGLANLIVEFARDVAALGFLYLKQPAREHT